MTRLELSGQERTTLVEVLESTLNELVTETAARTTGN